jgi:hypothetical protein
MVLPFFGLRHGVSFRLVGAFRGLHRWIVLLLILSRQAGLKGARFFPLTPEKRASSRFRTVLLS